MKIELAGRFHENVIQISGRKKNSPSTVNENQFKPLAGGDTDNGAEKIRMKGASIVKPVWENSRVPMKASDVLTESEMAMLEEIFSSLRSIRAIDGYKK